MGNSNIINKIQDEYFSIIREAFTRDMIAKLIRFDKEEMRQFLVEQFKQPELYLPGQTVRKSSFEYRIDTLFQDVRMFWKNNASILFEAITGLDIYTIVLDINSYIVDLSDHIRRLSIYYDSILFVDPLHFSSEEVFQYYMNYSDPLTKSSIAERLTYLLKLSELRSVNIDIPLFCIIPDIGEGENINYPSLSIQFLTELLFERDDIKAFPQFYEEILTVNENALREKLCHDDKYNALLQYYYRDYHQLLKSGAPQTAWYYDLTRKEMSEINNYKFENVEMSARLLTLANYLSDTLFMYGETMRNALASGSDPVVDSRNLLAFNWYSKRLGDKLKLTYRLTDEDQTVATSLSDKSLEFLEAVTINDLKLLRETGSLEDLRAKLRIERKRLRKTTPENIQILTDSFTNNMRGLINEYSHNYEEIQRNNMKKIKRTAVILGASATVGIASLAFPAIAVIGIVGTVSGLIFGGKSIMDLINDYKHGKQTIDAFEKNPVSILYNAYKKWNSKSQ